MSNCLYVGVDLGLNNFVVCVVDDQGKQVSGTSTFTNDLVGAERFVDRLLRIAHSTGAKQLKIGMEATNLYWWHLHEYLTHSDVYNRFRQRYMSSTHHWSTASKRRIPNSQRQMPLMLG